MYSTLVIGASENPNRYSYMAIQLLLANRHLVYAYGNKLGKIENLNIQTEWPQDIDIETVTLYVGATNQKNLYQPILDLKPQRVIFNPGTENPEFQEILSKHKINFIEACTLVMLKTGQY